MPHAQIEATIKWVSTDAGTLKARWAEARYGLKESKRTPYCVCRLLGKRTCRYYGSSECAHSPPGVDHPSLWLFGGKATTFVFQPYGLTTRNILLLGEFCRDRQLSVVIDTWPAWHYPGNVLFVEITIEREQERRRAAHDATYFAATT
jgi:hypothetical protein